MTVKLCPLDHEHATHAVSVNMDEPFCCPGRNTTVWYYTTPQAAAQARYARLQRRGRITFKEMLDRFNRDVRLIAVLQKMDRLEDATYVARYGERAYRRTRRP